MTVVVRYGNGCGCWDERGFQGATTRRVPKLLFVRLRFRREKKRRDGDELADVSKNLISSCLWGKWLVSYCRVYCRSSYCSSRVGIEVGIQRILNYNTIGKEIHFCARGLVLTHFSEVWLGIGVWTASVIRKTFSWYRQIHHLVAR